MRRNYVKPQIEMLEVASELGFVQSSFDSGFIVPGGGNAGDDGEWI